MRTYIYMYIYIYDIYIYVCIHIYIYIERERDRERDITYTHVTTCACDCYSVCESETLCSVRLMLEIRHSPRIKNPKGPSTHCLRTLGPLWVPKIP